MRIRDRIKEFRRVPARELSPHPANWRTHPSRQADALRGILAEVGYASALLARELPDGTLQIVDGHLRAETTPDAEVPVLVLDISEAEAAKLLAFVDPIGAMAEMDDAKFTELAASIETQSPELQQLLAQLSGQSPHEPPPEVEIPETYQVVIQCGNENEQREIYEELMAQGYCCRVLTL